MILKHLDVVIGRVLMDNDGAEQRKLLDPNTGGGLVNDYIAQHNITPDYSTPLTSNDRLIRAIQRLRFAGLIQAKGAYTPTSKINQFFDHIGDDWSQWPIHIPVPEAGQPDLGDASYLVKTRGFRIHKS